MRLLTIYWIQRIQIQMMRLLKRYWIQRIKIQQMSLLQKFWIQQYMYCADETLEKILPTADRFCIQRIHKQQMRLLKRYWIQRIQILQRRLLKLSNIKPLNPQMHCKNWPIKVLNQKGFCAHLCDVRTLAASVIYSVQMPLTIWPWKKAKLSGNTVEIDILTFNIFIFGIWILYNFCQRTMVCIFALIICV
jgi:hypothetical protein